MTTEEALAKAQQICALGLELPPMLAAMFPDLVGKSARNRKLIKHWEQHGFDLPIDDPAEFYSDEYWSRQKFRPYPAVYPGGVIQVADYYPPAPDWFGFQPLLEALWNALEYKPSTMLDVGCGCGSLVSHARRQGVDASGVDISRHAVEHPVPGAEGHIWFGDIRERDPQRQYDMVTATDLMEHIHLPYLDGVIDSLLRLTKRHLVMCICIPRTPADEWVHMPGTPVPLERSWIAVAGHVTLIPHAAWCERFLLRAGDQFKIDWKSMHRFAQNFALHPGLRAVDSWSPANILILNRVS